MGDEAKRPDVCHGMRQFPTPCSIALMIWDVTRAYTSSFSVEVFSFVDIEAPNQLLCLGIVPDSQATTVVFWKFANNAAETEDGETPASGSRLLFTGGYAVFNAAQVDGYQCGHCRGFGTVDHEPDRAPQRADGSALYSRWESVPGEQRGRLGL
jgi:hypothetical protein